MNINILDFKNDVVAKAKSTHIPGMDWQDIAQELFLHLLQNLHKYDPAKGASLRTFVVKISTNKILDLARRTNAQKRYWDFRALSFEDLIEVEFNAA